MSERASESGRERRSEDGELPSAEDHFGNYNHISAEEITGRAERKLKLISGEAR